MSVDSIAGLKAAQIAQGCTSSQTTPRGAATKIAVMTSGGDAQGMNAAVRAVVRAGLVKGCEVYAVQQGFQGLLDDDLKRMAWDDVSGYLSVGGTAIGTARCVSFQKEFSARRSAVKSLIARGIDRLICIGGDGSLTGANVLREEWHAHVAKLVKLGEISEEAGKAHPSLFIAGMVGSIDNDMCGTDMTIGANSALHRIVEALDAIMTTASSHQRSFVVEVMGRNCGYLALMAALATGADWVFIPERPVPAATWRDRLAASVVRRRGFGTRHSTVIVAEGAVDSNGARITAEEIKEVIEKLANFETRITVLGHIQRGGVPSAYDRLMSTLVGVEAVHAVLDAAAVENAPSVLIGTKGDQVVRHPLMECVKRTKEVGAALAAKDFDKAFQLRGKRFSTAWLTFKTVARALPHEHPEQKPQNWGVLHVGAPSPGMNAAVRAVVRLALDRGHNIYGIYNGCAGLAAGETGKMGWMSVAGWSNIGGALLGSNRDQPDKVEGGLAACAETIAQLQLDGLIIIGGWEAYSAARTLWKPVNRDKFPALKIPIVIVPATISNNCPATHHSIGADTAVNTIVDTADRLKQSAMASRRRVFILETMGGKCGYLTLVAALAGGAQMSYVPEKPLRLRDIIRDIDRLKKRFTHCHSTSLILNSECSSPTYTTQLLTDLFNAESDGLFSVRLLILGHVQQGHQPSPRDRELATALAYHAAKHLHKVISAGTTDWVGGVGIDDDGFIATPYPKLQEQMDDKKRRPVTQWWLNLERSLERLKSSGKHDESYRPLEQTLFPGIADTTNMPVPNLARVPAVKVVAASRSAHLSLTARELNSDALKAGRSAEAAAKYAMSKLAQKEAKDDAKDESDSYSDSDN